MAKAWTKFPYPHKSYQYTPAALKKVWDRLHRGDVEPFPKDDAVVVAWIAFHAGDFHKAVEAGLKAGGAGVTVANKAQSIYGNYLEQDDRRKLALFEEVAARAEEQSRREPNNASAHYWQAYALGRYAQGISVAKALAQGIGGRVKAALETALKLAPKHADAHIALGAYHAEVIDKVGAMIGGLTYGAKRDAGIRHFQTALKLNPDSAIARIEYANALVMLDGNKALKQAEELYAEAAGCEPLDAMERLDVELAKAELED
jgi:tetratricopeptide (TPR) repeat protein